jgi:hypothetical protein
MNEGQTWYLNRSFGFENNVELGLWEEDTTSADDLLGTVIMDTSLKTLATASFSPGDAHYELLYSVTDVIQ